MVYKAQHPAASEEECADYAGIARTTLLQQTDWQEWLPKVKQAAATGRLPSLAKALDKRLNKIVPIVDDAIVDD